MGFSKGWHKEGIKPKKASELKRKPVNVKAELGKLAPAEPKDNATFGTFGGEK